VRVSINSSPNNERIAPDTVEIGDKFTPRYNQKSGGRSELRDSKRITIYKNTNTMQKSMDKPILIEEPFNQLDTIYHLRDQAIDIPLHKRMIESKISIQSKAKTHAKNLSILQDSFERKY